jgi:cell division protein FtsB
VEHETPSPVDTLNELPPLPRRTPTPRRTGWYALVLLCVLLVANALVGDRGLLALVRANQEHARLRDAIDAIRAQNEQLHRYVQSLRDEPAVLEELARRDLGMIKPGERLFIVTTVDEPTDSPAPPPTAPPSERPADPR